MTLKTLIKQTVGLTILVLALTLWFVALGSVAQQHQEKPFPEDADKAAKLKADVKAKAAKVVHKAKTKAERLNEEMKEGKRLPKGQTGPTPPASEVPVVTRTAAQEPEKNAPTAAPTAPSTSAPMAQQHQEKKFPEDEKAEKKAVARGPQ